MYGKIFCQIYEGTLASRGPWEALVTFQQLIVLANKHGEVDMTPEALAARTTIPLEIIKTGLTALEKDDPESRSAAENGKRIVRLDSHRSWGWRIVNYEHYRNLRSQEDRREYMRVLMAERRAKQKDSKVINVSGVLAPVINVSQSSKQYAVSSKHKTLSSEADASGGVCEELTAYWNEHRSSLPGVLRLTKSRRTKVAARVKADPQFPESFKRAVLKASKTPFLTGEGARAWKASFDWLIENDKNYLAVLEGKYDSPNGEKSSGADTASQGKGARPYLEPLPPLPSCN